MFGLLCVLVIIFAPVKNRHPLKMYSSNLLNLDSIKSLNDHLSIDGLNDHCDYVESSRIKDIHSSDRDLSVLQLNIRGLLNKQGQIKQFLSCDNVSLPIDVVLLCETWLKPTTSELFNLPNYKSFHKTRKDRIGGGTSILVHSKLRSRERNDILVETDLLEYNIVELKTNNRNILLVSAYRPPNTRVRIFLAEYRKLLQKLKQLKGYEIVIGLDHNLDLLKSHQNQITNDFLDLNIENEILPSITKPTRITKTSATLIDNIMISRSLQHKYESFVVVEDLSDHLACLTILKDQNKCVKGLRFIKTRKLDDKKIDQIVQRLLDVNWVEKLNNLDASTGFNYFHKLLIDCIDDLAPEVEIKISYNKIVRDPWITKGMLNSIRKQKKLYLDHLKDTTITNKNKYKSYRNQLQKILRTAKTAYFREKCKEYKQDSRKLWKLIHEILNKQPNNHNSITAINVNGVPRYDPPTITNEFCKHFSTIGEKFARNIPPPSKNINSYLATIPQNEMCIFLAPTDSTELIGLLNEMIPKNSCGYDNISNKLLKKLLPSLIEPITIIFNKSLSEGVFPEAMKKADVVPLYKSKLHAETTNYRPISLLITVSKLLEKIMYKRTYTFLESTGQIFKSQYGFRTAHSCENAISELISGIIKGKQDGMYTLAVFLDLSKAFDSLEHDVLLKKLYKYGIRGIALKWFKSYLTDRTMRVKCNVASSGKTEYSTYLNITYGTPQGSCLGPLIFLIFTNDLYRNLVYSSAILFADDTTLYKTHRNLTYLKWCLEDDLNTLSDWFAANKLTLNLDKTVCILFQKNNQNKEMELKIKDLTIPNQKETKFLGMWLDQSLNWQCHIQKLTLKIKRNTYLLSNGKQLMDQETKKLVYYAHIASHIQYGLLLWGNSASGDQLDKIQKLQNKCIKQIHLKQTTDNTAQSLGILSIDKMIRLENMKFSYKLVHQMLPKRITEICCEDSKNQSLNKTHKYGTRNKSVPNLPKKMNKLYRNSFLCKGPQSWLTLSVETREANNLKSFIKKCKENLLSN